MPVILRQVGDLTFLHVFAIAEGFNAQGPCHRLYGLSTQGKLYQYTSLDDGQKGWVKFSHTELEVVITGEV